MAQTTLDDWARDPVDPETRAHVYSLITALGGIGDDGTYSFGDDALLCLKDLKRWLKLADGEHNIRDVARCMAEANLVKGDLLEILAKLSEKVMHDKLKHKLAVAALELLVPLTWPHEIDPERATLNQYVHGPYLELAQIGYKRAALHFDRARILQTVVRIAVPSMAIPLRDRTPRDEGIIRIALYFLRNITMLAPPASVPMDIDDAEVSRSTVIDVFQEQDIFPVVLSVASSIGEDFVVQDVIVLEILFYLLKGIDADKLFLEGMKLDSKNTNELKNLIQKEKAMLAGYARHAPTRHNRFGTMIWVKRDDDKMSTLCGQDVLGQAQKTMEKLDTTKKWNKPRRAARKTDAEQAREEFDLPVPLSATARTHIKTFVEEFLDSSFNPFFLHLRRALERETERVEQRHSKQFFYLAAWFLRAECARRRNMKQNAAGGKSGEVLTAEDESYGLIAEVMNQETFILLNRFMQRSEDERAWQDLNAGMKCFTQILSTVQEMSESGLDEDQEIAENIQNRIFYEETTHDRIIHTLRSYKDQGFGYLDAVTELAHVFLRMLERYAKQNVDLQVRSKRRARRVQKKAAEAAGQSAQNNEEEGDESENEIVVAQRTVSERKFDFARFAAKFVNQSSVNTFVAFAKYYSELNEEQLKRAHRFFHRVAFKMDLSVLLCRVDILQLLHKMVKGPDGLNTEVSSYRDWDEFARHFFRIVVKRAQDRPGLFVEMLFSKIPATTYYLEHGIDRELPKRAPRAPAELEVKASVDGPEAIGVAVGILVNQQKFDALLWIQAVLKSASEERKAWEDLEAARNALAVIVETVEEPAADRDEEPKAPSILVTPDSEDRRIAMFKDNKLRLLMELVGFSRLGAHDDPDASWIIASALTSEQLAASMEKVHHYEMYPMTFDDGKGPEEMVRSKAIAVRQSARKVEWDDDSDGVDPDSDADRGEYALDEATSRKADGERAKVRRRRRARTPIELDDEERNLKAQARRQKELEKQQKVKSTIFIHDSDDEDWDEEKDAAFFAREEALRAQTKDSFQKSLTTSGADGATTKKRKAGEGGARNRTKKARPERASQHTDTDNSDTDDESDQTARASSRASSEQLIVGGSDSEDEATDTPLSSQNAGAGGSPENSTGTVASKLQEAVMIGTDDDEDEDLAPVRRPTGRAVRAGFIVDSDSE